MTHTSFDYKPQLSGGIEYNYSFNDNYNLPFLPKIGITVNVIAAIFACIFTVIVTIANPHTNIDVIVILSKLIFCFVAGAVVAFLSASADYIARALYKLECRNGQSFWKCGEIVDFAAVAMAVASVAVFAWGLWRAFSALQGVDLHF
ncbi:MAG TPA: hypothetical protein VEH76_07680 [Methylocystis sp.]|nr:hypothetical protein [Methylocystis sp.]